MVVAAGRRCRGQGVLSTREYDPLLGRFLSVDPVIDPMLPQQLNAYAYGNNSPITFSDPDGLYWGEKYVKKAKKATKKTVKATVKVARKATKATVKYTKKAVKNTGAFIKRNSGTIVGITVGVVVTSTCLAATGGAGSVGCMALGGAAGAAAAYTWDAKVLKKHSFNAKDLAVTTAIGAVTGAAAGAGGKAINAGVSKLATSLSSKAASKSASGVTGRAAAATESRAGTAGQPSKARFTVDSGGTATDHVGSQNAISLGRNPAYVQDAQASGSQAFNVGENWTAMVARTDRFGGTGEGSEVWIRNRSFLDKGVRNGSTFRLASDPTDDANAGTFFYREVEYLKSKGYTVNFGRQVMLPPSS